MDAELNNKIKEIIEQMSEKGFAISVRDISYILLCRNYEDDILNANENEEPVKEKAGSEKIVRICIAAIIVAVVVVAVLAIF